MLFKAIAWEAFQPLLEKGYSQEFKSIAGNKKIDHPIFFKKILVLQ